MIRISTTQVRVGDHIRTYDYEGIVVKRSDYGVSIRTPFGTMDKRWNDAGSVILLSDLKGRTPAASYGRW